MLNINQLQFSYGPQAPQYDFSLQVEAGEILGISGKSGSGKSTLLDLIAGFLRAQSGRITLDDQELAPLPTEQRPISILFQKDNVFEHLTAQKNVELGLDEPKGADALLAQVDLNGFEKSICAELSGGQQQRVALARTLGRDRPILLLDEPFSALDDQTADEMRQLVRQLVTQKKWHTILVSHHQKDLTELATRQLSLSRGKLHAL
ncbi:hemin import ATP-binding protein HmuV [Maritalea myrionectae]|uniref:Hemin import ATP-binding protein HmuV n=1 Tax=Maritalea myrionectae TaxID=454601 RepID=A0A2R4MBG7_9HYPH|nr:ATP-binding cassette domain-containing protein [Maritalea myrionectae]AVX03377.1 hemin import ATP-binding protein HmuV [Maritalea myrionectae]